MIDREKFIEENLGLVHSCCHKFKNRGIEYDDMFQSGTIGLIKAVDGFDETRGFCFSTYAVPIILGEIKRMFRDGGMVKVSRSIKELSLKIETQKQYFIKSFSREPTVKELSDKLNVSSEEIVEALVATQPVVSLTVENQDGVNEFDIPIDSNQEKILNAISIEKVLKELKNQDKELIMLRYYNSKTQKETAEKLGMTQVQVSRKEKAVLLEIRKMLV